MTTVLIAQGADPYAITPQRCRLHVRLLTRIRRAKLDRALAGGTDPDSSRMLSLRATVLISAARRRSLAGRLRRILDDAVEGRRYADPRVPLARTEILRAQDRIEELIELLEQSDPVDPQGIARLEVLLTDGGSPLYGPEWTVAGELDGALDAVMDALEVPPTIPSAA